jgi:hypothetical protein
VFHAALHRVGWVGCRARGSLVSGLRVWDRWFDGVGPQILGATLLALEPDAGSESQPEADTDYGQFTRAHRLVQPGFRCPQ